VGPGGEFYIVGGGSTETTGSGFLVVKHDAFFNEVWRISHPARGSAMHAVVDSAGNLVVTGAIDTNTGITTVVLLDWMTIKLDPNGALLWSRTDGENGAEVPNSMVLGPDDSIYITGEGRAPVVDPSLGGIFFLQSTLTVKYAPDGTQLWAANAPADSISVPSALQGIGVKLGSEGGVFVLGQFPQTVYRYAQGGLANQPPVAMAAARPRVGTAPLEVNFSSAGSADPDGSIAGYTWDFGDGQTSTAANPSHTYAVGSYMARLTVTDSLGAASTSAPITITASAPPPPPVPVSLTPARSTVIEGASTTATVIVSSDAGVTLALASSNTAAARVPATVVIPAGETRATFTVRTSNVRRDTVVTLSATANGATAKASLTVRSR
jgi:PKD repeat protein